MTGRPTKFRPLPTPTPLPEPIPPPEPPPNPLEAPPAARPDIILETEVVGRSGKATADVELFEVIRAVVLAKFLAFLGVTLCS